MVQSKEERAAKKKEYQKNNFNKSKIDNWRRKGLIGDFDAIYERWINTSHCDECQIELCSGNYGSNKKTMDHCHVSGEFRNILCHKCNGQRRMKSKNNTSGHPNIHKQGDGWQFRKIINKQRYDFYSTSKIDCLCYKYLFILKLKAGLI